MKFRFRRTPSEPATPGQKGEDVASAFLAKHGFKILHRNVKTPRYEIDIIAKRKKQLYFVEVKYRSTPRHGRGHEYVTAQKLRQMTYAAQKWVDSQGYTGTYQLAVVSVDGGDIQFIDEIWQ